MKYKPPTEEELNNIYMRTEQRYEEKGNIERLKKAIYHRGFRDGLQAKSADEYQNYLKKKGLI